MNPFRVSISGLRLVVLALCTAMVGCDKIPTWQELTQQKPEQPPVPIDQSVAKPAAPSPVAGPEPVIPKIEKPDRNAILAAYKSTISTAFTDALLVQVGSIADELTEITTLDLLSNYSVSAVGLKAVAKLPNLKSVRLYGSRLSEEGFAALSECRSIESLDLTDTGLSYKGLESLKKFPQLRELTLTGVSIPISSISVITDHPQLVSLNISRTGIDDQGIKEIGQKCTNLTELRLESCTGVTDEGIKYLKGAAGIETLVVSSTRVGGRGLSGFKNLRFLVITKCPIDQPGATTIHGLPSLRELIANQIKMDDKGLNILTAGTKLTRLNVSENELSSDSLKKTIKTIKDLEVLELNRNNRIGDDGLPHLKVLKNLQRVNLQQTNVTAKGVELLKKDQPDLEVLTNAF